MRFGMVVDADLRGVALPSTCDGRSSLRMWVCSVTRVGHQMLGSFDDQDLIFDYYFIFNFFLGTVPYAGLQGLSTLYRATYTQGYAGPYPTTKLTHAQQAVRQLSNGRYA